MEVQEVEKSRLQAQLTGQCSLGAELCIHSVLQHLCMMQHKYRGHLLCLWSTACLPSSTRCFVESSLAALCWLRFEL